LSDWLPTGEGVLVFADLDEATEAIKAIEGDYDRHSRAARAIAEEWLEASTVMVKIIADAGWS
jgi:hypothetical protein